MTAIRKDPDERAGLVKRSTSTRGSDDGLDMDAILPQTPKKAKAGGPPAPRSKARLLRQFVEVCRPFFSVQNRERWRGLAWLGMARYAARRGVAGQGEARHGTWRGTAWRGEARRGVAGQFRPNVSVF